MAARKASEVFVECLESEGVRHVFGIPGEETLDLNESLEHSSIDFVPVRHEQGGGYMADVYGRLTGRAGVCLGTLGPGAMNLTTAVADAYLDHAPLVALTGQGDLERMHKESHQYIDVVQVMQPITKWNTRLNSAAVIPEAVRKAFKVAEGQKPGATHLELPEDVMAAELDAGPLRGGRKGVRKPKPSEDEIERAAEIIRNAERPIVLAGNGVVRVNASESLRHFSETTGIAVAETFMGRGVLDYEDPKALGSVGLQSGDYSMAGFDDADVVIAVGYDLVEQSPEGWNGKRDKTIVCIDTTSTEVDEFFMTAIDLIGDFDHVLRKLAEQCGALARGQRLLTPARRGARPLRGRARRRSVPPPAAARAVGDPPGARPGGHPGLRRRAAQAVDRAHVPGPRAEHRPDRQRPGRDGLRGAGGDRGQARAPRPHGDRGQRRRRLPHELPGARDRDAPEDAVRVGGVGEPPVRVDRLEAGQQFGEHFGTDFTNPDFVKLAESFGMPAWRCESADEYAEALRSAVTLDLPSLVVVPIDYSLDVAISEELGRETVAT